MKSVFIRFHFMFVSLLLLCSMAQAWAHHAMPTTFQGEIADSSCAMNIHSLTHSHQEMLKNKYMGHDNKSCTEYCVRKMGSDYVLSAPNKEVYHLDDQKKVALFSGAKVVITGSLDTATKTIHVESIEKAK